jgi:hypothetical protein
MEKNVERIMYEGRQDKLLYHVMNLLGDLSQRCINKYINIVDTRTFPLCPLGQLQIQGPCKNPPLHPMHTCLVARIGTIPQSKTINTTP